MDDKNRTDEPSAGHGLEGERPDVARRLRTGVETSSADPELIPTGTGVPGNTSETDSGTPLADDGADARPIRPRSPLGPGCARSTGTMFIASVSMLAIALRYTRR